MWWSEKLISRTWVPYAKVFGLYDSDQESENFLFLYRSQFFILESHIRHSVCLPAFSPHPPPLSTTLFLHKLPSYIFLGWSHILKSISAKFCGQTECLIEDSEIVHSLLTRKYGKPQGCNWKTCKKRKRSWKFHTIGRKRSLLTLCFNK